ncbi:septin-7-like [Channa argus]|uniref:septin-7-like n=1 Tax=Channa argus TaxID=215402 RepID=UPI0035215AA4
MTLWISNQYQDTISESFVLHSGAPAVYQLRPKKKHFGNLTMMTVGQKNQNKTNKTILLVGETGAGKSTLINTLVNYTMGVKFEDNIWFEIVEDENKSQAESQTSDVMVYEIFGFENKTVPYSLTIIDTPGYGDTRGLNLDFIVSQRLFDLFRSREGVHETDAVGLVMKASENRVSDRLRYIFDSVMSLFGKDLEEKIIILITHSDGITPENALKALEAANIKCAKNEKNQPLHFMFNNRQSTPRTEDNGFGLENAWRVTKRGMGQFTDFLKRSRAQKLDKTFEVLHSRIRVTACINNLQDRLKLIELKQRQIQQTQEALQKHEQEMKNNANFTVEVEEVYKVRVEISGGMWGMVFFKGAVCCIVCEENCHYPGCTMARSPEDCEIMRGGRCTVCTGRCPVSVHVKDTWRYVTKTKTFKRTENEMKAKYEKNKLESNKKLSLLANLQEEMEHFEAEKCLLLEESYQHVVRLEQIALNVSSLSTQVHLDFLIEKMKQKGDGEKVKKLQDITSQMDKGTMEALQYMFSNFGNKVKALKTAMFK